MPKKLPTPFVVDGVECTVKDGLVNVGLKGRRGKIVPFYYLHWWQLEAIGPSRTRLTDYELLKGSSIKFWLGATMATAR